MSNCLSTHLSKRQIEIMLKYYYMKSLVKVAKDENNTASQVKQHLSNGFRVMRLAYAPIFRAGLYFDGTAVLRNMAESSGLTYEALCDIYQLYITEGLASKDREFWEHALRGRTATPLDLISSLWSKFEADISPLHTWDMFGMDRNINK